MSETTIQWTERTWNPIAGCSVVSPGCTNCYAMRRVAPRLAANPATPHYHGTVQPSKAGPVWTGKIGIAGDEKFLEPLRIRKPAMWFVNSTSDLFHEGVPDAVIDRVFAVMALCPQHTFQVLTKRSKRMREYFAHDDGFGRWGFIEHHARKLAEVPEGLTLAQYGGRNLPNVWLGVSVEDQTRADERIPDLLATPAAIRFISAEPLLGPVDLTWIAEPDDEKDGVIDALLGCNWIDGMGRGVAYRSTRPGHEGRVMTRHVCSSTDDILANRKLDWVIVGGESGSGARPMNPQWARDIRDQCAAADVPFFHKQNGEWLSVSECEGDYPVHQFDDHRCVRRVGTKAAGRHLDGIEHNAMPITPSQS